MIHLLKLNGMPILEQLKLEEALLRTSYENWCILNTESPPAIVMGISGKPEKLLDIEKIVKDKIPVIKRFSGGGTVYIDSQTIFATFICNRSLFNIALQPKPILEWSEALYKPLFKDFCLRENDYVFDQRKFGGNALYIQRERWLLHTSFLWDYSIEKMHYLLLPEKRPAYRKERAHADFLCPLRTRFPDKACLLEQMAHHIQNSLPASLAHLAGAQKHLQNSHRSTTSFVHLNH